MKAGPAFGVSWMCDRNNLDQEGNHAARGGQHHAHAKTHEGFLEGYEVSRQTPALLGNSEITEEGEQGDRGPSVQKQRRLNGRPSIAGADIDIESRPLLCCNILD